MLNDSKNLESFYHDQNIQIRKEIRQMDMQFKQMIYNSKNSASQKEQQALKQQINFLVIGPPKSGKSSLLKTIYFGLNSNSNPEITISQLPGTIIKRIDIKRNKRYQIQGLVKIKQTDQKKTISAFEFEDKFQNVQGKIISSQQKSSKVFQKYSNALQLIDNRIYGCFKSTSFNTNQLFSHDSANQTTSPFFSIRTILIVLNILSTIQFEEISCMKFFLADIRQKGIKTIMILTHVDKLNHLKENQKLTFIDDRINTLSKQLDIKDRDDFICVQNYHEHSESSTVGQKSGQLGKYLLSGNGQLHNFQNPHNYNQNTIHQQEPIRSGQGNTFQYKKVSESYMSNTSLQMQIPVISKHQKSYENYDEQNHSKISQNAMTVSRSISCNSSQDNRYAKVSTKNNRQSINIAQNFEQKYTAKKGTQINYQPSGLKSGQQMYFQQSQITNIKNSQEINYYSLKLLIKILKQSQKYVNRELKDKKMSKWFCG